MGALNWIRVATRAVGLKTPPEYPHLEALLEAEEGQPHNDYRLMAKLMPPIFGTAIGAIVAVASFHHMPILVAGEIANVGAMYALWRGLDYADKSIPGSKVLLRKNAEPVWERYNGFANLVGVEPALSPNVGHVLDEAAAIYLKHSAARDTDLKSLGESYAKAQQALEAAMAKMLELAKPTTVQQQELLLESGWAFALLQEMRDMDLALSQPQAAPQHSADPLANLRAARMEIQGIESAIDELEQTRTRG